MELLCKKKTCEQGNGVKNFFDEVTEFKKKNLVFGVKVILYSTLLNCIMIILIIILNLTNLLFFMII